MGTASGVQLENPALHHRGQALPTSYIVWLLGIFFLASTWLWAAFVRGRVHSGPAQALLFLIGMGVVAGCGLLSARILQRQFALDSFSRVQTLAYSSSAFLLLFLFLPEYLLGRPVLARSFVLLGFSALLFAGYLMLSLRRPVLSLKSLGLRITPGRALVVFCFVYFLLTSWLALAKLHAFGYVGQDIAYFTQCLHTTLHGHLFYSNMYHDLLYGKPVTSDLAGHNQLVLFLMVPFFALHKSASTLLIVRNVSVVLCAWPVYWIGRRFLSPALAAMAAATFLLIPAVLYQNFYDFAPLSLAALPLLFALYYFLEESFVPYLIALICAQMVREDLVFAVFGLGLLALWRRRSLRWSIVPCVFALGWAFLSWKIMFPYFLQGATPAVASCFAYLGSTPREMVHSILHHPGMLLSHENLLYAKQMVDSFGGVLFLLNPVWIISLPYIAINVLAEGGGCNTAMIYRHYSFVPTVFLFVGALLAMKKVGALVAKRGHRPQSVEAAILLFLVMAALSSIVFVTGQQQFEELKSRPWHEEAARITKMLPPDASVAVPRYLLPRVANRDGLYQSLRLLEYHHPDASYIVIDKDWQRMAATEQWRENYDALRRLLETDPQYQTTYDSPNYVIYKLCDGCAPNLPHREPRKDMHD